MGIGSGGAKRVEDVQMVVEGTWWDDGDKYRDLFGMAGWDSAGRGIVAAKAKGHSVTTALR
jgi:hypothetical protein